MNVCQVIDSPLGKLTMYADEWSRCTGLYFENHAPGPVSTTTVHRDPKPFAELTAQLSAYFANERDQFEIDVSLTGTEFQVSVWTALRQIAFGETATYADIARGIGRPKAIRAVGAAVGRNPISIIIPCHRVIGSRGELTGFAGGLSRKQWLLDHEEAALGEMAGNEACLDA